MKAKNSLFISFEGPEASGKSSQIKLLSSYFRKNRIPFIVTREPGGTKIAEKLRKIILDKKQTISNMEEILLFMASRLNNINNIIKPALKLGKIVISDRFADSTFVYQGYVNNFGLKKAISLHESLLDNFLPNRTFLFQLSPRIIISRLIERKNSNKYDKININFHKKIIEGYELLSKNNKRFYKIDATKNRNIIHNEIINKILEIK
tara:strand:- start:133 stop:753 length:621 start_codon:yes stop_codon:yes gene_type:complete